MFKHQTKVRVRYGETDQMGYLYYGNYALYYEVGRVEALRSLGIVYKQLEEKHELWMPVLHSESKFIKPAYYDEVITIVTQIKELPRARITFFYQLFNEEEDLINEGNVTLCFIDANNKKPLRTPEFIKQKLQPHFV
jgi:acyl-CoA thioester hydrolase